MRPWAIALVLFVAGVLPGQQVLGRVVDADGKPVTGAQVELLIDPDATLPPGVRPWLPSAPIVARTVTSGRGGRFKVAAERGLPFGLRATRGQDLSSGIVQNVAPGRTVDLQLSKVVEMKGRVVGAEGEVVVQHLLPTVRELDVGRVGSLVPWLGYRQRCAVQADGAFSVRAPIGRNVTVTAVSGNRWEFGELSDGATAAVDLSGALSYGVVLEPSGQPLQGARVRTLRGDVLATTGEDGRYEIGIPGQFAVFFIEADGWAPTSAAVEAGEYAKPDAALRIPMRPAQRIQARLVTAAGRPLANRPLVFLGLAYGELMTDSVALSAKTDGEGRVDVRIHDTGSAVIGWVKGETAWYPFFADRSGEDVDRGKIVVETGRRLRGAITEPDGTPAAFATIMLQPDWPEDVVDDVDVTSETSRLAFADHAGRFDIRGLGGAFARYRVACVSDKSSPRVVVLDAERGPKPANVELPRGFPVRGVVRDAEGEPVSGVRITGFAEDVLELKDYETFGLSPSTISGPNGEFTLSCWSDEPHRVMAYQWVDAETTRSATVGEVDPGAVELELVLR